MTDASSYPVRRALLLGLFGLVLLFGGFGSWAVFANISGAIVSSGRVAVESNRQVVQHPDGGVVAEILVREGDLVDAGDVLIRLDPTLLRSNAEILRGQLQELTARAARLRAERDTAEDVAFPPDLVEAAATTDAVAETLAGQRALFVARAESRAQAKEQLSRRKEQIASQVDGIGAQQEAIDSQLNLIREELDAQQSLLDRGLAQAPRVLALRREEAGLLGQVGDLAATVAELKGRTTEIDLEILKLGTQTREAAITELRDLEFRQIELAEQYRAITEQLNRLDITAPADGVVYDMQVFAKRAVIRAAEPVLYLVPQDRPLVIQTRVDPIHIDQVFPGQPVTLRLPTFDARTTPELFGEIVRVSPDAFTDDATGQTYYQAEVLPNEGEIARLGDRVLLPGMPVEAYLRTQDRTPLAYLTKPMTDYFTRAFRE
ncbi:Type I secretion system membrane fusion protein PrsE [Jannaschia seosinensis]|uniref:Membrane fusion protein (MFP) family protein n=1 Tax=Jannaschia seosinensis TaxID=313367 RepID=A0A0M7BAG5_9RHOB|nr:HlyD family type I secretion periplasmic adaptor subunit [Jannaschia seosinensis]CUH38812.1 Type I secretion system membrane fusion protein PrsE [Jannaschia seosinensis]